MEQVLGTCLDEGIKVVTNAGGLDPAGCAEAVHELAARLGLSPQVAHVDGDDLIGRDLDRTPERRHRRAAARPRRLTANAYLGGWAIAAALRPGADVVITGRVTDAAAGRRARGSGGSAGSPTTGIAWPGSVVAGHIIECGSQATGGNYAFFERGTGSGALRLPHRRDARRRLLRRSPSTRAPAAWSRSARSPRSSLYEIAGPRYLNPDVVARFDTIPLSDDGPDRVRVSGVRGEPPPGTLKVAVNYLGGYRNTMTFVLTGLDIEAKARLAEQALWARVPPGVVRRGRRHAHGWRGCCGSR